MARLDPYPNTPWNCHICLYIDPQSTTPGRFSASQTPRVRDFSATSPPNQATECVAEDATLMLRFGLAELPSMTSTPKDATESVALTVEGWAETFLGGEVAG